MRCHDNALFTRLLTHNPMAVDAQAEPLRLIPRITSLWAMLALWGTPDIAILGYTAASGTDLLGQLPLFVLVAAPSAGLSCLAVILSTRKGLRRGRSHPAPPGAEFRSGSRLIALAAAFGLLLGAGYVFQIAMAPGRGSAATVAVALGLFSGALAGTALAAMWYVRRQRELRRTYWAEAPRLRRWYDRSASYYRPDDLEEPAEQVLEEPLKLIRMASYFTVGAYAFGLPALLGVGYELLTGQRVREMAAEFAVMFAFISLSMGPLAWFSRRKALGKAVLAPPDAEFPPITVRTCAGLLALGGVNLAMLAFVAPRRDAGPTMGAIVGLSAGFAVVFALIAQMYRKAELRRSERIWSSQRGISHDIQGEARGSQRGVSVYTTPVSPGGPPGPRG